MTEHRSRSSPEKSSPGKTSDNISPEELVELREAFRVFDQDGDVRSRIYS
jgi:Ca2+-binding EF-hand superfamily protein